MRFVSAKVEEKAIIRYVLTCRADLYKQKKLGNTNGARFFVFMRTKIAVRPCSAFKPDDLLLSDAVHSSVASVVSDDLTLCPSARRTHQTSRIIPISESVHRRGGRTTLPLCVIWHSDLAGALESPNALRKLWFWEDIRHTLHQYSTGGGVCATSRSRFVQLR